jgi:predicted metal-dependent phosphoesterase TrpH
MEEKVCFKEGVYGMKIKFMQYRIDLHCHSWFSADGVSRPEAMIRGAKAKGLSGFALTDHDTSDGCRYLVDQGLMRMDGKPVDDFLIIPGVEVSTAEGHLLCLGVMLPKLKGCPAREVGQMVHAQGGLVIPAHPYDRFRAGIRESVLETLEIDGVEVFNAATRWKRFNEAAYAYAERRKLPMTAGSDAHHEGALGTAYTIFSTEDFSVGGILGQIALGTEMERAYISPREAFRKTLNNWFRFRQRRSYPEKA